MSLLFSHVRKLSALLVACAVLASAVVRLSASDRTGPEAAPPRDSVGASLARRVATSEDPVGRTQPRSSLRIERFDGNTAPDGDRAAIDADTLIVHRSAKVTDADADRAYVAAGAERVSSIEALGVDVVRTRDPRKTGAALERDPAVAAVEPNRMRYASAVPNDPGYVDQAHLFLSRFPVAWELSEGAPTLDIAIVDTGVDRDHPDLDSRITFGRDFVNGDANAQDDNGHGTMVAGLAAAETSNGIGVAGATWNGRIMPLKVLDADGAGTDWEIAQAIVYAADNGAEVINLSLGGPGSSDLLEDVVVYATSRNVVVVAAAGNESTDEPSYPAAIPSVVAVGSTDLATDTSVFTNYGPWVDLVAPGEAMVSTALADGPVEAYAEGDGTSFAAPVVAGAALLHKARTPSATAAQIASTLASSAADRGPRGIDRFFGRGLLDAYAAAGGRTAASPPLPDAGANEPNHLAASATPINANTTDLIEPVGDVDWFRTDVNERGSVTFTVSGSPVDGSRFDPVLEAFNASLDRVAINDNSETDGSKVVTFGAEAPGRFYLRVRNRFAVGTYAPYAVYVATTPNAVEPFGDYQHILTGSHPEAVAVGDVIGNDGLNEVVMSTHQSFHPNDYKLLIFRRKLDGRLDQPIVYAQHNDGGGQAGIAVGDMDDDGDEDVVLATNHGVDLFVQTNGVLGSAELVSDLLGVEFVQIADMDGDGDNEIVALSTTGLHVLTRTSTGFVPRFIEGSADVWAGGLSVGDVNDDGRMDLVGYAFALMRTYLQQADGSFISREYNPQQDADFVFIEDTAVGDFNDDGREDVVVSGEFRRDDLPEPRPGYWLFEQSALGSLEAGEFSFVIGYPEPIEAADMNRDGRMDLVAAQGIDVNVLYQQADGTLDDPLTVKVPYNPHYNSRGMAVGDVNGDLFPDVAIANHGHQDEGLVFVPSQLPGAVVQAPPIAVRAATPGDSAVVGATTQPTVDFRATIDLTDPSTVDAISLRKASGEVVAANEVVDAVLGRVTLTPPTALTPGETYVMRVDGLEDINGVPTEAFESRFTVAKPSLKPAPEADINGDGYDDVIVGAPGEDVGSLTDAGAFHVLLGSSSGAKTIGSKLYTQDTKDVPGTAEAGDAFGASIATGDVNADGYDDVAVGAPGEDLGSIVDGGLVHVFLGSATGLRAVGSQTWTQDSKGVPGSAERSDRFGAALAFGAFDDVGGDDIAIGTPNEAVDIVKNAGAVYVLSGRSTGLTATGAKSWTRASAVGYYGGDNFFGAALAAGDFDGDTHDELVVGAPGATTGTMTVFSGTIVGPRPAFEITSEVLTGLTPQTGERFGAAIATGDFGGLASPDGYADLAVGAPGAENGAGRVDIVFSDWMGPGLQVAALRQTGNGNHPDAGDLFGASLSASRTSADDPAWLAIGAPGEDELGVTDAGVVHVMSPGAGFDSGLLSPPHLWQDSPPVQDAAETSDRFGTSVRVLDVDRDGFPDVVVGTPNEKVGTRSAAGTVHVLRHADHPATVTSQQLLQGANGVPGAVEPGDRFGASIGG